MGGSRRALRCRLRRALAERMNKRNGTASAAGTRASARLVAIPRLRAGSYFPDWLLQPRRRAEQAFDRPARQGARSQSDGF